MKLTAAQRSLLLDAGLTDEAIEKLTSLDSAQFRAAYRGLTGQDFDPSTGNGGEDEEEAADAPSPEAEAAGAAAGEEIEEGADSDEGSDEPSDAPASEEESAESDTDAPSETTNHDPTDSAVGASEDSAPLSVFQRAEAAFRNRESLLAERNQARDDLAAANDLIAEQQEQIASLTQERDDALAEAEQGARLAERIAELEGDRETVSEGAARIAASSHVESDDLPESSADEVMTLDEIRQKIRETTDPREKARLAKMARDIRLATGAGVN